MSRIIHALLVDDEPAALAHIERLLSSSPTIEIVAKCSDASSALNTFGRRRPIDLIFLDVQLPDLNGIELIRRIPQDAAPLVIFVTDDPSYALEAFELNAVDYLLKPVSGKRLKEAIDRAQTRLEWKKPGAHQAPVTSKLPQSTLQQEDSELPAQRTRLAIKDGNQTYLIDFDAINWIDAAGDYMCVNAQGKTHILRSTMSELEAKLSDNFARVHRSTIVNLNKVQRVESLPKGEGLLHLDNDVALKVSRHYRDALGELQG